MTLAELLEATIAALNEAAVAYMVTGSLASSYHGEPRATRDIDMVIDPDLAGLDRLVGALLRAGLYVDGDAAISAFESRSQFNAIADGAAKVDFIIRRERPFSVEEFARRRPADLLGTPGFIVSPEDLVIAKLEWASAADSDLQLRDVAAMLEVGGSMIDSTYVETWVARLNLGAVWRRVGSQERPPGD